MSAEEAAKPGEQRIEVGGGTVVYTQPLQVGYTLRREEFELLCEGEIDAEDKRWRDVCLGIAVAVLMGFLSVVVAVDWQQDASRKSWRVWIVTVILGAGTLAAFGLFFYLLNRLKGRTKSSGYQRTKEKIHSFCLGCIIKFDTEYINAVKELVEKGIIKKTIDQEWIDYLKKCNSYVPLKTLK